MDYAHKWTDTKLKAFEKEIAKQYKQPVKNAKKKLDEFLNKFKAEDRQKRLQVKSGNLTEKQYKDWKIEYIVMSVGFLKLIEELSADFHTANKAVMSLTVDFSKEIYAENYNYGTYEVEKGLLIDTDYELYNVSDAEPENPKSNMTTKDTEWNKQQMQSVMIGFISVGVASDVLSRRFANEMGRKNVTTAIRAVERIVTSAENSARADSYARAEKLGVSNIQQEWVATLDGKTRHTHRMLDGMRVRVSEPFEVEGYTIRYPCDPEADPEMVCNCRCTLVCETNLASFVTNEHIKEKIDIAGMSYNEWKALKVK